MSFLFNDIFCLGWSTCCADGDSDSEGDDHDHHDDHNNHKQTSQLIQHNSDNDQQKLTILNDDHYDSWLKNKKKSVKKFFYPQL